MPKPNQPAPASYDFDVAAARNRIETARQRQDVLLDLSVLELTSVPESLGGLTSLQELYLHGNRLTSLPESLGRLSALRKLSLFANQLTSLPESLGRLTSLRALYVQGNQLTSLPESLGGLASLETLNLSNNQLTSLPESLGGLMSLQRLELSTNQLTSLPESMGGLTALQELYLHGNQLTSLPESLGGLTALQALLLQNNQLTSLPESIGGLTALHTLLLQNNQLTSLPEPLRGLDKLGALFLHENPGLALPDEVLGPTSNEYGGHNPPKPPAEILDYYFRIRRVTEPGKPARLRTGKIASSTLVLEARMIVIGDGESGKTSLVRALLHNRPARKSEETTRDVVIEDWPNLKLLRPGTREKYPVAVHVWDFGGQEPMHAAHPYFFTKRTLYVVVATAREVGVEERVNYWLKLVAAHGQGARAVVVINKTDQHPMDITVRELCAAHKNCLPANPAEAFFPTSCKPGKVKGIAALRSALLRELKSMDQIWTGVPLEYLAVKKKLEECRAHDDDTLTFEQWEKICEEAGVLGDDQRLALELLRDLGTVVSFPDDNQLNSLGVLNPSWVTKAIYPLLTSKELAATGGLLQRGELGSLLNDAKRYPKHKHEWLIQLMKKFELLFENDDRLLLPARLPKDAPDWVSDASWSAPGILQMELRFPVLPESIISKFIVRSHEQALRKESWWRHGIALKDERGRCSALVRAFVGDPGRIELRVEGPKLARQHFVAEIRGELRKLTSKLDGELWVLLDGAHPEKYDDLLVLVHQGREHKIKRVVNNQVREFDLIQALDLIEPAKEQQQALAQMIVVGGDATGNAFGAASRVLAKESFQSNKR